MFPSPSNNEGARCKTVSTARGQCADSEAFAFYQALNVIQSPAWKFTDNVDGQGRERVCIVYGFPIRLVFVKREPKTERGCLTSLGPLLDKSPGIQLTWGLVANPTSKVWLLLYPLW